MRYRVRSDRSEMQAGAGVMYRLHASEPHEDRTAVTGAPHFETPDPQPAPHRRMVKGTFAQSFLRIPGDATGPPPGIPVPSRTATVQGLASSLRYGIFKPTTPPELAQLAALQHRS